jgi:hypothetical protein
MAPKPLPVVVEQQVNVERIVGARTRPATHL